MSCIKFIKTYIPQIPYEVYYIEVPIVCNIYIHS